MRKVFTMILAFCLCAAVLAWSPAALADTSGDWTYTVSGSECAITGYTGSASALTIPATLAGYSVTIIDKTAFMNNKTLTSVVIPEGVKEIRVGAFFGCENLASVRLPDSLTGIIGSQAFFGTKLTSVEIPGTDIMFSLAGNLGLSFGNCPELMSFTVRGQNSNLFAVDGVLYDNTMHMLFCCPSGFTSYTLPDSVSIIDVNSFIGCYKLTDIIVGRNNREFSSVDGALLDKSGTTLLRCPIAKKSYTIPASVTVIEDFAFDSCALKSIVIPEGVTTIERSAFQRCRNLTSVTIPSTVTSIGEYTFNGCNELMSVAIPKGVSAIGSSMFQYCYALKSVTIPASVTKIGSNAFNYCNSLKNVYYEGTAEQWDAIEISAGNDVLSKAAMHFGSTGEEPAIEPTATPTPEPTATPEPAPTIDPALTGFTTIDGAKVFVDQGAVYARDGLINDPANPADWYFCSAGVVREDVTQLVLYDNAWFYVVDGKLDTTYVGIVDYDGGRFLVAAGRIMTEVNGLNQDPATGAWFYYANGQIQTQYTGLAQYDGAWFYIVEGRLDESFTGDVQYDGAWFHVVNGQMVG